MPPNLVKVSKITSSPAARFENWPRRSWTSRLLAQDARSQCLAAGHPSLQYVVRGSVSRILRASKIRPERIEYYLEKREPEFETKMATVLHVYKQVEVLREVGPEQGGELVAVLFYDEKPGI